jgi:hypothetical protein
MQNTPKFVLVYGIWMKWKEVAMTIFVKLFIENFTKKVTAMTYIVLSDNHAMKLCHGWLKCWEKSHLESDRNCNIVKYVG